MDNLGDWLYIVLLVIAGLSGLLSSGKKKKPLTKVEEEPEHDLYPEEKTHDAKSFWELLEDVQAAQTRPKEPKPKPQPVKQPVQSVSTHKPLSQKKSHEEENAFQLLSSESFHDTEELKKAIIYSEILNRKY